MQGVDLLGFAGDCTITAKVTMFGDRLTDFLNGQERFHIHKVIFESLDDGHLVAEDSVSITRDDLLAVIASGPRGSEQQRVELAETRMQLSIGPYLILGRVHTAPGIDPVSGVMQRDPMVPLTDATIAYSVAGNVVARDVGTLIVNRKLVDWIVPVGRRGRGLPGLHGPRRLRASGRRAQRRHQPDQPSTMPSAPVRMFGFGSRTWSRLNRSPSGPVGAPPIRSMT